MAKTTVNDAHRKRILKAALALLTKQGRDAVTTRSVAQAAKVQPPVLYRIFGDKTGLLDAVAAYGFEAYIAKKHRPTPTEDPLDTLRTGWATHVEFGLANPELYLLMYGSPRPIAESPAAWHSFEMLGNLMQSVAASGRLRFSVTKACALYYAAAVGIVMYFLSIRPEERDLSLSDVVRDHALNSITTDAAPISTPSIASIANWLHALLSKPGEVTSVLTEPERLLISEWLLRLTAQKEAQK